jgi:diaminopimelate epimerase
VTVRFTKAHAYGNDFLYVLSRDVRGLPPDSLARELCDRHTGIGADGLILFTPTADGASMELFNADGGRAEVSGNGVRGLGALLLRHDETEGVTVTVHTQAGSKAMVRTSRERSRQTFRSAMGLPRELRQTRIDAAGESLPIVIMDFGNPQAVIVGTLPAADRFQRLGPALERHPAFPQGTNVEFAEVLAPDSIQILIWERGVGPTTSSGTGSCASLIAAAEFGGAARDATVMAPGGAQRVEWLAGNVYLTGWAEVLFDGEWLREIANC